MGWLVMLIGGAMVVWGIRLENSSVYMKGAEDVHKERSRIGRIVGIVGIALVGLGVSVGGGEEVRDESPWGRWSD